MSVEFPTLGCKFWRLFFCLLFRNNGTYWIQGYITARNPYTPSPSENDMFPPSHYTKVFTRHAPLLPFLPFCIYYPCVTFLCIFRLSSFSPRIRTIFSFPPSVVGRYFLPPSEGGGGYIFQRKHRWRDQT